MAKPKSVYERLTIGNRMQRKDVQRRLYAEDPGLEVVQRTRRESISGMRAI
ncbi:MAG: hypothetical protein ABIZ80_25475 [Bryobacteraceae bacterium]